MRLSLIFISIFTLLFSCNPEDEESPEIPSGSLATPVYNQAYQENFEVDEMALILAEAKDAYVLLDPFGDGIPESIAQIKSNGNEVGAYISIGTGETYRSDYSAIKPFLVSKQWGQWPDEFFVNATTTGVMDIMKTRIDKIADWGCDWVEFDNMDWIFDDELRAEYGFQVTQGEGIAYYQALCDYVHEKGMKCMAKNLVDEADAFDGVLYESYDDEKNWWDNDGTKRFLDADKLVIVNHYNETNCGDAYNFYKNIYTPNISFICEDRNLKRYVHFNQ